MLESLFEISVQEGRLRWLAKAHGGDEESQYLAHTGVSHQEHFECPGILGHFDMDIHLFAGEQLYDQWNGSGISFTGIIQFQAWVPTRQCGWSECGVLGIIRLLFKG